MGSQSTKSVSRLLVTGGSGYVGRALLATAAPFDIRVAMRSGAIPEHEDQVIVGDIDDKTDWSGALHDIDFVVHLAAHVHVMRPTASDMAEFERTNIWGTARFAQAAVAAGVKRFVYLSSIKVNGEASEGYAFRAGDVPSPSDGYARSKLEAERRLAEIASTSAMAVSIVRSPLIYGPGVRANFLKLLTLAHSGIPIPLASISNVRSMVGLENLCDLIRTLLLHEQPMSGVFLVSDGESISTPELLRRLARLMHRPARLFALPVSALRVIAAVTGQTSVLERLCGSLQVDISETRTRLGWSPPVTLDEELARTVDWYLQQRKKDAAA